METCVGLRNHALWESLQVNEHYRLIMANKENVVERRWTLKPSSHCGILATIWSSETNFENPKRFL